MTLRILGFASSCTIVLALAVPVLTQPESPAALGMAKVKQQTQETSISLSSDELRKPHYLQVKSLTAASKVTGRIELNGKYIKAIDRSTQIDLSPWLTPGKHTVKITGQYYPSNAIVEVKFSGTNTQISQQTSGNGYINQTLIIEVRS